MLFAVDRMMSRSSFPPQRQPLRASFLVEPLETRTLFAVAVGTAIPNSFGLPGGTATDINLAGTFDDTAIQGLVARLNTSLGNIDLELFDQAAPKTVQNFANYIANNLYNQTVLHRLVSDFVIQGGGYLQTGAHIQEGPKIASEFSAERPNLRGTISMVTVANNGMNRAGSEWVINLADNPTLDTANGGFTVFGHVINGTMGVVDQIAQLPIIDATPVSPVFAELPVRNVPAGNPTTDDFVFINAAEFIPDTRLLTLTATSDNPALVNPTVSNGVLRLNYGNQPGSARITVTARDSSGNEASQTFTAGVGELIVEIGDGGIGSKLNFVESDGGQGTVSLTKGGTAFVRLAGDGLGLTDDKKPKLTGTVAAISNITTIDTGTNSALTVKTRGGDGFVDVRGISTDAPLRTLSLKSARLTGDTTIGGTLRTASLGDLINANVVIGGAPGDGIQLGVKLGTATESNITSGVPIRGISAAAFVDTNGTPGVITAPSVTTVKTTGALQQSIETPGGVIRSIKAGGPQMGNITADSMGSFTAQDVQAGIWNFSQGFVARRYAVGKVIIRGAMTGTTIRAAGSINTVQATVVTSGRIYAGVSISDEELPPFLPVELGQFAAPARINKLTVRTDAEQLSIAAASIGKVFFGEVGTDAGIRFGIAATQIDRLAGKTAETELGPGTPFQFRNLDDQGTFDATVDAINLPLGNFVVNLF